MEVQLKRGVVDVQIMGQEKMEEKWICLAYDSERETILHAIANTEELGKEILKACENQCPNVNWTLEKTTEHKMIFKTYDSKTIGYTDYHYYSPFWTTS